MQEEQLYAGGRPFSPKTNSNVIPAADAHKLTGRAETTVQEIINAIADRIVNRLLEKSEISDWAKAENKPDYTASEVGADASGSADRALADAKAYADGTYMQATGYTDAKIADLINGAPSTLDTLGEIADAMADNEGVVGALEAAIGNKASEAELQAHASNGNVHITRSEREGLHSAVEKLKGVEEGANRVTLTKSLAATEEGTGLDAVVGPIIMQRMDSLNSNLTNSINEVRFTASHLFAIKKILTLSNGYVECTVLLFNGGIKRVMLGKTLQALAAGRYTVGDVEDPDFIPKATMVKMEPCTSQGRHLLLTYGALGQVSIITYQDIGAGVNMYVQEYFW